VGAPVVVEYHGCHRYPATPRRVWDAIGDLDQVGLWGWLHELRADGPCLVTGSVLHGVVVPPLPYRIRLEVEFVDCVRPSHVDAEVGGDLVGDAHLRLRRHGSDTEIDASWTLEMRQPAMRIAARVMPSVMRWGHDRVVEATAAALGERLRRTSPTLVKEPSG
jgi:hypothetical protein